MVNAVSKEYLSKLLEQYPTPFYFYNTAVLKNTINEIKNAFPIEDFQLLFATMANDNVDFIKNVFASNVGACINSINHLNLVQKCGLTKNEIQFTSTGLSEGDMNILLSKGITANFDSLSQLERWFHLGGRYAGLRINAGSLTDKAQFIDRLGIDKVQVNDAIAISKKYNSIVNGIHVYVGTNYKSHLEMMPALDSFFELATSFTALDYVNIGGGVGVDYQSKGEAFNIKEYGKNICELTYRLRSRLKKNVKLVFEPGRFMAAPSGFFVTRVTDIKRLNRTRYIVVDASVSVFPRPFHHPDSPHNAITPFKNNGYEFEESIVVGRTTFSRDILLKMPLTKKIEVGDIILFDQAGAYCDSMRSKFLGQNEPFNVFISES